MTSLTLYGLETATSTLATACKLVTGTGGTSANLTTKVGTVQGSGELFSLGSTATFPGTSVSASAGVHGFLWDVTTLEGQNILSGTWTVKFNLNWNATYTTMTSTITARVWKRSSGGVYTKIGSDMTVAGPGASTTAQTLFTLTGSNFSSAAFATGDKLYLDVWLTVTSTGGNTSRTIALWASSSSTAGIAGQVEIDTPGYSPSKVTGSSVLRTRVRTQGPSSGVYAATVLADKPVRYYHLNDSSGTTAKDASGNGQDGTLNGGVTLSQAGLIAQDSDTSMLLNGTTGYISLPTTGLPSGASSWTIEAWIELSSLPAAGNYPMVVYLGTQVAGQTASIYYNGDTAQIQLGVDSSPDLLGGALSINTIYHLVGTYDGTTIKLYVNNVLKDNKTITLAMTYGVTYIGNDSSSHFWTKYIDEVALYSYAFSATQVTAHYNQGTAPTKALGYLLRTPVRTQVTKSVGLRVVTTLAGTLKSVSSALRTRVRTLRTLNTVLRLPARTQITLNTVLRLPARTQKTLSAPLRVLVRTLRSASVPLRSLVRTQITKSVPLRTVIKGITALTSLRVPVRSLQSRLLSVRIRIRTQVTDSLVFRMPVNTVHSLNSGIRAVVKGVSLLAAVRARVRTIQTAKIILRIGVSTKVGVSARLRTLVGTLHSLTSPLRMRVRSQVTRSLPVHIAVRGMTQVMGIRLPVRMQVTVVSIIRIRARMQSSSLVALRTLIRTVRSRTASLRTRVSAHAQKSAPVRTLVEVQQALSLNLRIVVTAIGQLATRFAVVRLLVKTQQNALTRLRARVKTQGNVSTALRAVIRGVTATYHLRLPVATSHALSTALRADIRTEHALSSVLRVVIQSRFARVAALRARVHALRSLSTALRTRVRSQSHVLIGLREVVSTQRAKVGQVRARIHTNITASVPIRLVARGRSHLAVLRTRVATHHSQVLLMRTLVKSLGRVQATLVRMPIASRAIPLVGLRTITTIPGVRGSIDPPLGVSPGFYQGQSVVPTRPSGVYVVNGVVLDSQPVVCTAPLESTGLHFLPGSTFFLLFDQPTAPTQSLLANGSVVSMTFALSTGQMVTGQVQVASTLTTSADAVDYSVLCTLLSPVTIALPLLPSLR